jgi:hypothetical protein
MSNVLIIVYELSTPAANSGRLLNLIKGFGSWARVSDGAYLVATSTTPLQVREQLNAVLVQADKLYVGPSPPPSAWRGQPDEVSQWILANQK